MTNLLFKYRVLFFCVLLGVVTFAVYLPVRNHEFVRYDDDVYVTNNSNVQSGLTWQNIKWAFTTGHASNWHPLTWLSLMLDCTFFKGKSGPLHIVNVLFHVANTLLLFVVLSRMTKAIWPGAFVAALFALHPLHVESVAWVAERKDLLSTLFWLLTMLSYVFYVERPSSVRYIISLVLFALGLMAKPMLVTLPFVLLLLDFWPLLRFATKGRPLNQIRNFIFEKVPFFVLSVISSVITFFVQQKGGAVLSSYLVPINVRFANAICSYFAYIKKMFWPADLAVLYPHPVEGIPASEVIFSAIVLVLITVFILYYSRRYKYLLVGWLWYLGTLVPVIGIVQVGVQAMADRYTYVPLIGLFIIIAFGADDLFKNFPFKNSVLSASAAAILVACILTTSAQLKYWKDSTTLFEHTLAVTNNNTPILNNYGNVLGAIGRPGEAEKYFVEALRLLPDSPDIRNNYGKVLKDGGKFDEAVEQYKMALKIKPDFDLASYNLGVVFAAKGDYDAAIEQYKIYLGPDIDLPRKGITDETTDRLKKIWASKSDTVRILSHLGYIYAQKQDPNLAVQYYDQALRLKPDDIITHGRLALALAALGKIDESIEQCQIVLDFNPDDAEMHTNLGILYESKSQIDQAVESYKKTLQIDPNSQKARDRLNALSLKQSAK